MDAYEFYHSLEDHVSIPSGRVGIVLGLHIDRERRTNALVQYSDTTGAVHEDWFSELDLGKPTCQPGAAA